MPGRGRSHGSYAYPSKDAESLIVRDSPALIDFPRHYKRNLSEVILWKSHAIGDFKSSDTGWWAKSVSTAAGKFSRLATYARPAPKRPKPCTNFRARVKSIRSQRFMTRPRVTKNRPRTRWRL